MKLIVVIIVVLSTFSVFGDKKSWKTKQLSEKEKKDCNTLREECLPTFGNGKRPQFDSTATKCTGYLPKPEKLYGEVIARIEYFCDLLNGGKGHYTENMSAECEPALKKLVKYFSSQIKSWGSCISALAGYPGLNTTYLFKLERTK